MTLSQSSYFLRASILIYNGIYFLVSIIIILYLSVFCLHVWFDYATCDWLLSAEPGDCVRSAGTTVTNDSESPCECWESIMSP